MNRCTKVGLLIFLVLEVLVVSFLLFVPSQELTNAKQETVKEETAKEAIERRATPEWKAKRLTRERAAVASRRPNNYLHAKWKVERLNKERQRPVVEHDKLGAFTMAQDFVTSNLKCPRTAKWPWISYTNVTSHLGNGKYLITSYLDAQNGFGALVRINFTCVVEHVSGSNWRLVQLVI